MTDFKRDLEILINEGVIAPNHNRIRFVFRYSKRFKGSLEGLDLSERAYNCLRRANIDDISKVADKWDDLGRIKNAGVKTVKEVKNKYIAYYYGTLDCEEARKEFWQDTIKATIEM